MDAIDKNGVPRSAHDLLMDIRWNCEHCAARIQNEGLAAIERDHGLEAPDSPCAKCRLSKYGYGGRG